MPTPEELPATSADDESTPEPSETAARIRRPSGPATLTVTAMVAGQFTPATVRVLDASGAVKAKMTPGAP